MRMFLLASAAALFWSGAALAENLPTSPDPVPETSAPIATPPAAPSEERPMVSQGNPAWRSVTFGDTTVGRSGCLAMSLYDTLVSLGVITSATTPATFVRLLSAYGLFTSNGLLRWSLDRLFPGVWAERLHAFGSAALDKVAAALSGGKQVLLEVATDHGTDHWVVVSRVVNGDAEIRDPNGGRIGWLSSWYGVKSIRGMATITAQ